MGLPWRIYDSFRVFEFKDLPDLSILEININTGTFGMVDTDDFIIIGKEVNSFSVSLDDYPVEIIFPERLRPFIWLYRVVSTSSTIKDEL